MIEGAAAGTGDAKPTGSWNICPGENEGTGGGTAGRDGWEMALIGRGDGADIAANVVSERVGEMLIDGGDREPRRRGEEAEVLGTGGWTVWPRLNPGPLSCPREEGPWLLRCDMEEECDRDSESAEP